MYGQTEATARLSYLPPDRLDDKLGSIGRGLPHTRLEVLRPDGTPVQPGSDEVGEIVASGENVTLGYWGDPEETGRYFRDGKLYTGDMARVDADGFIFIVERARDFIKAMGYRVGAKRSRGSAGRDARDRRGGRHRRPRRTVGRGDPGVCRHRPAGPTYRRPTCRAIACKRLPNYKVPQHVEFLPTLPKLGNGKVDKESASSQTRRT